MSSTFGTLSRRAKLYVATITGAGTIAILQSLFVLVYEPIGWRWMILAGLTLVSGSATVRLPSLPATISVSETFVFTSVLLFGPAAGTITVALDALVISLWAYKQKGQPLYKSIFNVAALALTIWLASQFFFLIAPFAPLAGAKTVDLKAIVLPLVAFTIAYFSLNSWIITFAISLERALPSYHIWKDNFLLLSLNYFGGASVAALLVSYTRDLDFTYLAVIVPLLIVLYFTFSTSMGRVEDANRHLRQLNALYMSTIETLAMAIDAKDQITHGHIRRVQTYAVGLAKKMGVTEPALIRAIEAAALLHDMGKLAVPEYILNKPGPLTPAEFEKMKLHASVGADILSAIDFPYPVVPIVRHHHENWDGTGYPDRLKGADIPIGARILSVVDCFDALTSDRPYRPRLSDRDALRILLERRGRMYDPLVVDMFIGVHAEITPNNVPIPPTTPLRAITEAATSPATTDPKSGFDDISGSTEEMLTLFSLARGLTSLTSLSEACDVIAKHLRRLIPSSLSVVYVYDSDADELLAAHASGDNSALIAGLRIGVGQRLSGWVAANRQTIRNSDPVLDFGESARGLNPRLRSCLSTPLLVRNDLVGVLTLYSTPFNAFSEEHQRVIEIVAKQVASVIKQGAASSRGGANSHVRDKTTGLPHFREFSEATLAHLVEATPDRPVSLLLIDVDDLARINQQYGRSAGDDVLVQVVKETRKTLRTGDLLFRHRNDELVALLLQTDEEVARAIGGRIARVVQGAQQEIEAPRRFGITVSVASSPKDGKTIDELIAMALARQRPRRRDDDAGDTQGDHSTLIH